MSRTDKDQPWRVQPEPVHPQIPHHCYRLQELYRRIDKTDKYSRKVLEHKLRQSIRAQLRNAKREGLTTDPCIPALPPDSRRPLN